MSVSWPGASPQDIEEQIVVRIEEALADMDGIETITSTARESVGYVNIEGKRNVDIGEFIDNIKLEVDSVNNLPPSAYRPIVSQWRNQEQVVGFAVHGDIDRRDLQAIGREVRDEVAQLPGASIVNLWASRGEEVSIEVSEDNLRRYNLSFDEIVRAVRASSLNASAGTVRTELGEFGLTARQLADTAPEFENIIIRQTSAGGTLRINDVARVTDGFVDSNMEATYNGETMVLIVVEQSPGIDVVDTAAAVHDFIERKQAELPEGVSISLWWDNSEMYSDRMETISSSALFGGILVLITLFLFLRPIVAVWVTVGIFTAFGGAFLILPMMGVSLNMLSLFAFLIVIGIVVDDASWSGKTFTTGSNAVSLA